MRHVPILASLAVTLILAPGVFAYADPDSPQAISERAALVDFALDPSIARDEPMIVRCPMSNADLLGFQCAVYNASDERVGSLFVAAQNLPTDDRRRALERCAGAAATQSCVGRITVTVNEFEVPVATAVDWPYE